MSISITIDGGASQSRARLHQAGVVGGPTVNGPPLSLTTVPAETVVRVIAQLVDALPATPQGVSAMNVGLAGAMHAERARSVAAALSEQFGEARVKVVRDVDLVVAQLAAPGVALVIGTGVAVIAPTPTGEIMVDGRGFAIADRGGGAWIGLEALRLSLQQLDRSGHASPLLAALLERLQLESADGVAAAIWSGGGPDPARAAALAPVVLGLAGRRDPDAERIVARAVTAVTESVGWALTRAGVALPAVVVAAGGLTGSTLFWARIQESLTATGGVKAISRVDPLDAELA